MDKKQLKVIFYDGAVKDKLDEFAKRTGFSLNALVNLILSAEFKKKDRDTLQLLHELVEEGFDAT